VLGFVWWRPNLAIAAGIAAATAAAAAAASSAAAIAADTSTAAPLLDLFAANLFLLFKFRLTWRQLLLLFFLPTTSRWMMTLTLTLT
jgi:hypothetical protein